MLGKLLKLIIGSKKYHKLHLIRKYLETKVDFMQFEKRWREKNINNQTFPVKAFDMDKVSIGDYTYGPIDVYDFFNPDEHLIIKSFVSIASGVKFILGGNHQIKAFSTYPYKFVFLNEPYEAWTKGEIVIEDDVWIGIDSIILSGVTIGRGAVIAAGSVITKDVMPYTIVGGNPAKKIRSRFSEEVVNKLMDIDFNSFNTDKISKYHKLFYQDCNEKLLEEIRLTFFNGVM